MCAQLGAGVQRSLVEVELDLVGLGNPLGVEDHVGGRHGHGAQVSLGTLIAASRGVPAIEHIGVLFQIGRIFRLKIVAAQRRFVLYTAALTGNKGVVIVEAQVIAVAGVVEVVRASHLHLSVLWEVRIRITLRETGNGVELLGISQAGS